MSGIKLFQPTKKVGDLLVNRIKLQLSLSLSLSLSLTLSLCLAGSLVVSTAGARTNATVLGAGDRPGIFSLSLSLS
ncbi:MAG: hypothetical protein KJT03_24385, partial [Verrucomicrobiae bacterium]|nr:hypothetical protein [Verrucomicrobiae bacterium]